MNFAVGWASQKWRAFRVNQPRTRCIQIGNQTFGNDAFQVIAGPCSIESHEQFWETAMAVKECGATALRGGLHKLRTSPNSFQGLGESAYAVARSVSDRTGLPFVSEVTDPRQIESMLDIVDGFQVGTRNMHNYALLKELGQCDKPVVLKRNFSGLIEEWLAAAEYITQGGNPNVILCERGIRTFENKTRNTLDLNAVAYVKAHSSFPVIVDPSHGTGLSELVAPMALAAAAVGADGLIIEVHPRPATAKSDGFQALDIQQFSQLMNNLRALLPSLGRKLGHLQQKDNHTWKPEAEVQIQNS